MTITRRQLLTTACAAALIANTSALCAAPNLDLFNLPKGQWLVCRNGHRVAQVVKELNAGTMNWGECIGNWLAPKPTNGQPLDECLCHCGASYIHGDPSLVTEDYYLVHGWPKDRSGNDG